METLQLVITSTELYVVDYETNKLYARGHKIIDIIPGETISHKDDGFYTNFRMKDFPTDDKGFPFFLRGLPVGGRPLSIRIILKDEQLHAPFKLCDSSGLSISLGGVINGGISLNIFRDIFVANLISQLRSDDEPEVQTEQFD